MVVERRARPAASDDPTRRRMVSQRRAGTRPERELRSELHRRGLRFRVDRSVLDGSRRRHDIVFVGPRVVVDVRGCFWHACPVHGTLPRANREWWQAKLEANRARDENTEQRLRDAGWEPVVVWEHEAMAGAAARVERVVRERAESSSYGPGST
jgi:DNA mismatch endonuclease (patch repair protein)